MTDVPVAKLRNLAVDQSRSIEVHSFQAETLEDRGYRVFPDVLENEEYVCFHGTAEENLHSIIKEGFSIVGNLPSVSFARSSSLALKYACEGRTDQAKKGCIIVVRFDSFEHVVAEASVVHVFRNDLMPTVVGYSIIPANYEFR